MNKREFFLKTVIAMAGNPRFVDDGVLDGGQIIDQATALADTIEEMGGGMIDGYSESLFSDSQRGALEDIGDVLNEIKEIMEDKE